MSLLKVLFLNYLFLKPGTSSDISSFPLVKEEDEKRIYKLNDIPKTSLINLKTITVSGHSSGACFAVQMHYMFSKNIRGAGEFAGAPFGLMYNLTGPTVIQTLLNLAFLGVWPLTQRKPGALIEQTVRMAEKGVIDPVENLKGAKGYIFNGKLDFTTSIVYGFKKTIEKMWKHFGTEVRTVSPIFAGHVIPTDNFGGPCLFTDPFTDGVANCQYQGIFDMFQHLYGPNYIPPLSSTESPTGKYYVFDQSEFVPNGTWHANEAFMHDYGMIYVPKACENSETVCQVHVGFHGCFSNVFNVYFNNYFAKKTGYFQVADVNNVIVVFPQAAIIAYKFPDRSNFACWDWFGVGVHDHISKNAPQVRTVANIVNRIVGHSLL